MMPRISSTNCLDEGDAACGAEYERALVGDRWPHDVPCRLRRSQRIRKRIEEAFGWIKTVAGLEQTKFRGCDRVEWAFSFAATAYNLMRLSKLLAASASAHR